MPVGGGPSPRPRGRLPAAERGRSLSRSLLTGLPAAGGSSPSLLRDAVPQSAAGTSKSHSAAVGSSPEHEAAPPKPTVTTFTHHRQVRRFPHRSGFALSPGRCRRSSGCLSKSTPVHPPVASRTACTAHTADLTDTRRAKGHYDRRDDSVRAARAPAQRRHHRRATAHHPQRAQDAGPRCALGHHGRRRPGSAAHRGGPGRRRDRLGPSPDRHRRRRDGRRRGTAPRRPALPPPPRLPGHGRRRPRTPAPVGGRRGDRLYLAAGGHRTLHRRTHRRRRPQLPAQPAATVLRGPAPLRRRTRVLLAHPGPLRRGRLPQVPRRPGLPRLLRRTAAAQRPVDLRRRTRFPLRTHRPDRRGGTQRRPRLRRRPHLLRPARRLHLRPDGRSLQRHPGRDRTGGPQLPQIGAARPGPLRSPAGLPGPHPQRLRTGRPPAARRDPATLGRLPHQPQPPDAGAPSRPRPSTRC